MPIWVGVLFFIFTFLAFIGWGVFQSLILRRLKKQNNGKPSPLVSKDGININIHTSEFNEFLSDIEDEKDVILRKLKIWHKRMFRLGIIFFILSFIIVINI